MEEKFPGYYKLEENDYSELWRECIFVFDTNVLLNLYRYKKSTREELLEIFRQLRKENRVWIPYQVALEYHDERLNVINSLINAYDEIKGLEKSKFDEIKKRLENYNERHPIIDVAKVIAVMDNNYKSISQELEREKSLHPNWYQNDDIKTKIYYIFDERVGTPYSQEYLEEIFRRGKIRYSLKIPPGYEDRGKKKEFPYKEYGDLILWFQLIDESKRINKPMIFVTDDTKKDWWMKKGGDIPCPELIQEFYSETNCMFYIYSPKNFIKWSKQYLHIKFSDDAIKEIESVKRGDERIADRVDFAKTSEKIKYKCPKCDKIAEIEIAWDIDVDHRDGIVLGAQPYLNALQCKECGFSLGNSNEVNSLIGEDDAKELIKKHFQNLQ